MNSWRLASEIRFIHDGWNLGAELDSSGSPLRTYTWGLDLGGGLESAGGVGGLLIETHHSASTTEGYFPTYDGNGNIMALVEAANGQPAAHFEYGPFGERVRIAMNSSVHPFGYSSKYTDDETNLVYYGYRYYQPSEGRWLSRDPSDENGGPNLYSACANNCINTVDKLGLFASDFVYAKSFLTAGFVEQVKAAVNSLLAKLFTKVNVVGRLVPVADIYEEPTWYYSSKWIYMHNIPGTPGGTSKTVAAFDFLLNNFSVRRPLLLVESDRELPGAGWTALEKGAVVIVQNSTALTARVIVHEYLAHFLSNRNHGEHAEDNDNWDRVGITNSGDLREKDEVMSCAVRDFYKKYYHYEARPEAVVKNITK